MGEGRYGVCPRPTDCREEEAEMDVLRPAGALLLVASDAYGQVAETRPEWFFETQPILSADPVGGTSGRQKPRAGRCEVPRTTGP